MKITIARILLHLNASLCTVHHQYIVYRRRAPFIQVNDYLSEKILHEAISLHGHSDTPIFTGTLPALKQATKIHIPQAWRKTTTLI